MPSPELNTPFQNRSDAELMAAYQNDRQDAALVALFRRYEVQLFGRCLQLMRGNRAAALDLQQDTVLTVMERLQKGTVIRHFPRYLFQVSGGKAIDQFRKQQKWRAYADELAAELERELQNAQDAPDFALLLEEKQQDRRILHQGIEELGGFQTVAIRQFFLEGATYREIAEQSGEEISRVKSALQNGKLKLKKWLADKFRQP